MLHILSHRNNASLYRISKVNFIPIDLIKLILKHVTIALSTSLKSSYLRNKMLQYKKLRQVRLVFLQMSFFVFFFLRGSENRANIYNNYFHPRRRVPLSVKRLDCLRANSLSPSLPRKYLRNVNIHNNLFVILQ